MLPEGERARVAGETLRGLWRHLTDARSPWRDHLPSERPEAADHKPGDPDARHLIQVEADSWLAGVLGVGAHPVNTLHHQAVRRVGPGQRIVARSPDGVIEAIESIHHERDPSADASGWELGVQWHPEKLPGPESDRLFRGFIEVCAAGSEG